MSGLWFMILLPIAQANRSTIKATMEETVPVKPQYLRDLIVLINEMFLAKQWIGRLIVVTSIATIEKITSQENIIMIDTTLKSRFVELK